MKPLETLTPAIDESHKKRQKSKPLACHNRSVFEKAEAALATSNVVLKETAELLEKESPCT